MFRGFVRPAGAFAVLALFGVLSLAPICGGQPPPPPPPLPFERTEVRQDCTDFNLLRNPYFGDTHVHTTYSLDTRLRDTRVTPSDAYAFALGATIGVPPYDEFDQPTRTATIDRPLDFVAVSDHSEWLGLVYGCTTPGSAIYDDPACVQFRDDPDLAFTLLNANLAQPQSPPPALPGVCGAGGVLCTDNDFQYWTDIQDAAESAYDRTSACTFTSFVAYEWSGVPSLSNLHRNVIFRNANVPPNVSGYFSDPYVDDLFDSLEADCLIGTPDCDVLTIPHNSNLGRGFFFDATKKDGNPFDTAFAARKAEFEPLIELFQHKGSSECLPGTSATDELCDFEVVPWDNIANLKGAPFEPKPSDYIRYALQQGMIQEDSVGANPFKYGFIGSTDGHYGTPGLTAESETHIGHGGSAKKPGLPGLTDTPEFNPGGLAVVWAEENSRDALFEAMRRRETYATSGTRPIVRFFGGWNFHDDLCTQNDNILKADNMGVPMGSDMKPRLAEDWIPKFFVSAFKDLGTIENPGTDLQRVQIIKGWIDSQGNPQEEVYEVAGDPDNGADVDTDNCQTSGSGDVLLCTVWTDPDFDPTEPAFYYARVIENPTCRWSQKQCNVAAVDCNVPATITTGFEACCDGSIPAKVQERAWTSPIWYTPDS